MTARESMIAKLATGVALILMPIGGSVVAQDRTVDLDARSLPAVRSIDDRYQSFQVGFSHLTGGDTWISYDRLPSAGAQGSDGLSGIRQARAPADLGNRKLRALVKELGPFYVRYSGTTANSVYFHDSDTTPPATAPEGFKHVLTRAAWKGAVDFARAVDAKIVTSFTNSPGVRDGSGAWTPGTAAPWIAYSRSIGGEIYAAELYNEPNAPEEGIAPDGHSAAEFARDFAIFRTFMASASPETKLAGPGVAKLGVGVSRIDRVSPADYAVATPAPKFDIISYHFYPALAERCAPATSPQGMSANRALTTDWLARPDAILAQHKELRDRAAPGAPIWITETGGAACGGLRWQPTFLDMFRYMDSLARQAKQGLDAIFTHALISGSNGVIDEQTFDPNASYWAAVLWRRLMGTQVLDAGPHRPGMQLYAHCLRGARGGVTLMALNLQEAPATVSVTGPADLYALTGAEMQGKTVLLNGRELALGAGDAMPDMVPRRVTGNQVALAPSSVNFIVLPQAGNPACGNGDGASPTPGERG
jgi:heparanase